MPLRTLMLVRFLDATTIANATTSTNNRDRIVRVATATMCTSTTTAVVAAATATATTTNDTNWWRNPDNSDHHSRNATCNHDTTPQQNQD